jgi:uncharacterized membrane protein
MNETLVSEQKHDSLRLLSLLLVLVGIIISGYLSYTKLTNTSVICAAEDAFSCDVVQNSVYSKIAGIEIAYLGLLAYLLLGVLLLLEPRINFLRQHNRILIFGLSLFAFVYAIWLVYVQAFILAAFCSWCLAHEVNITLFFFLSALRLGQQLRAA